MTEVKNRIEIDLVKRYQGMPKNLSFICSDVFQSALFGGFGNGKTEALCWRGIVLSQLYPKGLGLIGRDSYPELRDSTIRSFFDVCPPELIRDYKKQENMVIMKNDANIIFRAFDDPRKVLSINLAWFLIDQLEEIMEEMYLQLLGRLRSPECRFAGGVGNPEPGWVKRRFKDYKGDDVVLYEATTFENPHLPPDYVQNLIKNYPEFWVKRYVYGDWNVFEGQVFSEFMESRNVCDPFEIPKEWKVEYLIDYGYRNPMAFIKVAIDHDDNYYLVAEHYVREQIISWHAPYLLKMGYNSKSFCQIDPSCRAQNRTRIKDGIQTQCSIIDEFNEEGIFPVPANNDISGIMRANQWFKEGRLKIFRNCTNAIKEVSEWRWKKVKPNWNENLPEETEDKNDHICDLIKYFANGRPSAPPRPKHPHYLMAKREEMLKKGVRKDDWYRH